MRRFPPTNTESATEVGDEDSNHGIRNESTGDTSMSSIVGGKHDLLPKRSEEKGGGEVPSVVKEGEKTGEEESVSNGFFCVVVVMTSVETFVVNALVENVIFGVDGLLGDGIEGGEFGSAVVDFCLYGEGDVVVSIGFLGECGVRVWC